ncbi:unnamed protein product, partial [marine sediment metagenome]
GWIGLGPKTQEFEERFAEYIGVKYAVGVNSATAALHLACHVLGLKEGDEIIVPSMTFVSTALAPLYCRAAPVFADIEEDTLCLDPADFEKKVTSRTKAIIPVHYGGHACRMDEIMEIARRHNLYVIEDVAHGCGGKYKNNMLGSIGQELRTKPSYHYLIDYGLFRTQSSRLQPFQIPPRSYLDKAAE